MKAFNETLCRFRKIFSLPALLLSLMNLACSNPAAIEENPVAAFVYPPAVYGTSAWDSLSFEEQEAALQFPVELLPKLLTGFLIEAYLDYPYVSLMFAYADVQTGFDRLSARFNVIPELLLRQDLSDALLKFYNSMDPSGFALLSDLAAIGKFKMNIQCVEILLAQSPVVAGLNKDEIKQLFTLCLRMYHSKVGISVYDTSDLASVVWPMGRVMWMGGNDYISFSSILQIPDAEYYLKSMIPFTTEIKQAIIQVAMDFVPDWQTREVSR